jgi:hypothetical protein
MLLESSIILVGLDHSSPSLRLRRVRAVVSVIVGLAVELYLPAVRTPGLHAYNPVLLVVPDDNLTSVSVPCGPILSSGRLMSSMNEQTSSALYGAYPGRLSTICASLSFETTRPLKEPSHAFVAKPAVNLLLRQGRPRVIEAHGAWNRTGEISPSGFLEGTRETWQLAAKGDR